MPLFSPSLRRLRFAGFALAALILIYALAGWFGIPAAVRWALSGPVSQELGRAVSVEHVRANPFTLRVEAQGLSIAPGPGETEALLSLPEAVVNLSWTSVVQRAPVIDHLSLRGLNVHLVRTGPQQFNISDIVERILAKPASPDPTHFAVYNIELSQGRIRLDDRVRDAVETISDISLGIPFISNFPSDRTIEVQPAFSAQFNGRPFSLKGETLPFEHSLQTVLKFDFKDFDLPHLASFSPIPLNFEIRQGRLSADLSLAFRRATAAREGVPAQPERLILAGSTQIQDFDLAAPHGKSASELLGFKELSVQIDELGLLVHEAKIASIKLSGPKLGIERTNEGLNWQRFVEHPLARTPSAPAANSASTKTPPAPPAKPWHWQVKRLAVEQGEVQWKDRVLGLERKVQDLSLAADGLSSTADQRAKLQLALNTPDKAHFKLDGEVGLSPLNAELELDLEALPWKTFTPYLANTLAGTFEGTSSASAKLHLAQGEGGFELTLDRLKSFSEKIQVRGPTGSGARLDLAALELDGGLVSLKDRRVELGRVSIVAPRTSVTRLADGAIGWQSLLKTSGENSSSSPAPWQVQIAEIDLKRGQLAFEDLSTRPATRINLGGVELNLKKLAPGTSQRADVRLRAYSGRGWVVAGGWLALEPVSTWMWVDARNLNLAGLRPYFAPYLNAVVASAEASARGNFELFLPAGQAPIYGYSGSAQLSNLHVLEADGETDLLRWQSLGVDKLKLRSARAQAPLALEIGQVALKDFYARIILSAQGKLNLADVIKHSEATSAQPAPTGAAPSAPPADSGPASNPSNPPDAPRPAISVAGISVSGGNINFSDNFIKPNYTANITGLAGTIDALSSDDAAIPAKVDLNGKIDGDAPVTLAGTINPLARQLSLDLRGSAEGIDLPSFTPYSAKYAGYPITKGKLSLKVDYKVADGQLSANNQITLDQLTFGERVDSPDATKLPVLLAVSLLKNSQGNINIDLPISGSLNDPQFSVGGIIFHAVVNLITKAVTSPFSLLASAFGGGGEELGYVAFAPGSSALEADQLSKLGTLARALMDRPGLKLDIIGRVDPALDIPGLKQAKLDAKLRAERVQQLLNQGQSVDPALVTISSSERPELIATVYGKESLPDKPRNFLGFAKSIPTAEQEKLLLANIKVTPEDLRALANQRAFAVRANLEAEGQVPQDRIFIVEPRLNAEGIKDGAPTPRVDFELK